MAGRPLEACQQHRGRQVGQTSGRQLDSQGQPVQEAADRRERGRIGGGDPEVGLDLLRTLHEEAHRATRGQILDVEGACETGQRQRGDGDDTLAGHVLRRPADGEDLEPRARGKQGGHEGRRRCHVLEVVEQQQHMPAAQVLRQALERRPASSGLDPQRLGDGRRDEVMVAHGGQGDQNHASKEGTGMTLAELLEGIDVLDDELTIYASDQPEWKEASEAIACLEPDDGSVPSKASGLRYLLEVRLAKDVSQEWRAWRGNAWPTPKEKCEAVIYYALNDSYWPVDAHH